MDYIREILRLILFLPREASTVSEQVDWLHFSVISLTMFGAFAIALIAAVFCIRYRQPAWRRPGTARKAAPPINLWAEMGLIGGLFALFVGWWGVGFWQYVKISAPPAEAYDIYVSAKQWMWKFAYPDGSHTINTLYVPAQRPIRLILTARDVIHSFFVPDFRVKHDAVPGRYTTVWFTAKEPGTHHVFCTEYCGTWHSRMRAEVVALSEPDFAEWLRSGERERDFPLDPDLPLVASTDSSLVSRGEQVAAAYGCLRCHSVDGSPHIAPTFAGLYESKIPLEGGAETRADVAYLTESMMDPNAKIHRGFAAVMPSYIGYLKPPEVGALVSYIKSLQRATTVTAIAPAVETGTYSAPDTNPTREPAPAGEIGQPPGQPKTTTELEAQPRGTGPLQSGSIESAPNPLPRGTPQQLQRQMLQRRDDAQNGRQP
jgi:cytochrome c oxidase subunit II